MAKDFLPQRNASIHGVCNMPRGAPLHNTETWSVTEIVCTGRPQQPISESCVHGLISIQTVVTDQYWCSDLGILGFGCRFRLNKLLLGIIGTLVCATAYMRTEYLVLIETAIEQLSHFFFAQHAIFWPQQYPGKSPLHFVSLRRHGLGTNLHSNMAET